MDTPEAPAAEAAPLLEVRDLDLSDREKLDATLGPGGDDPPGALLAQVGEVQEITVTDAEMQQAVMQQAQQYPGQERQFFEFLQQNEQMQQQMRAPIFEDKVVDYIIELAEVTEKSTTKEDLQKAVEDLENDA